MTKTSANTWKHKGWDISFFGNGYRLTRIAPVKGKFFSTTAASLSQAKIVIDRYESTIKIVGEVYK